MGRIVRADVGKGKRLSNTFQEGAGFDQFTVVHPTIYFCAPCYDFDKAERFHFRLRLAHGDFWVNRFTKWGL